MVEYLTSVGCFDILVVLAFPQPDIAILACTIEDSNFMVRENFYRFTLILNSGSIPYIPQISSRSEAASFIYTIAQAMNVFYLIEQVHYLV